MRRASVAAALALVLGACDPGATEQPPFLDLTERIQVPSAQRAGIAPLRVAVAAILSPEGTIESYAELADYLGDALDRPVEIMQRRTYAEINDLLETGGADIGFVCTSAYVRGHDEFGLELLAAPQIGGESVYYSELIVASGSTYGTMADLRGTTFAFTDPMSTTGRVYPTYLVNQLGETPESFFGNTVFTYSHESAIESVAAGVADGAGVDSLVLEYVLARQPDLPIRVIDRSPAFAIPPVVVAPHVSARQAATLQELLFSLSDDRAASAVLATLGIDGFVPVADSAYDGVREITDRVELTP